MLLVIKNLRKMDKMRQRESATTPKICNQPATHKTQPIFPPTFSKFTAVMSLNSSNWCFTIVAINSIRLKHNNQKQSIDIFFLKIYFV